MEPEDIEGRDFFVGLRGYDRDEVHAFLTEVAAEQRTLKTELDELRNREPAAPAADPFADLGASVTAILRTANESASSITAEATARADEVRAAADADAIRMREDAGSEVATLRYEADEYAEGVRREVDEEAGSTRGEADRYAERVRGEVEVEAEAVRAQAATTQADAERITTAARDDARNIIDEAHAESARILAEADGKVAAAVAEAEREGRERAVAAADAEVARIAEATRRYEGLRGRLAEASDEIQLALMAMGEPTVDPAQQVRDVIVLDDAEQHHQEPVPQER